MLVEPTAPSAVDPANRPTTATSDMLNSTCSRLDRASGRLTSKICLARGPSVRVLVVDFIVSFFLFRFQTPCPRTPGHKLYYKARRRFCKMKNTEKQGEHFCLHFLRGCAILLYTDECISPRAIVAQLDRAFGSDPEGQRFESSRSHQEKPRHIVAWAFLFCAIREDSNSNDDDRCLRQKQGGVVGAAF